MVQRQKTLATFGAGPFATGDAGGGRFGHYTFDDNPVLLGIMLAEFHNIEGPIIRHYVPYGDPKVEAVFQFTKGVLIPKPFLYRHSLTTSISSLDCKVLMYPVGQETEQYERNRITYDMAFIVDEKSSAETMYEPIVQKCAEYMTDLEREFNFLTEEQFRPQVRDMMDKMFKDLSTKGKNLVKLIHNNMFQEKV